MNKLIVLLCFFTVSLHAMDEQSPRVRRTKGVRTHSPKHSPRSHGTGHRGIRLSPLNNSPITLNPVSETDENIIVMVATLKKIEEAIQTQTKELNQLIRLQCLTYQYNKMISERLPLDPKILDALDEICKKYIDQE